MSGEDTPEKTTALRPAWKPGQSGNPKGRPKGARSRLSEDFLKAVQQDFEKHGVATVEKVRERRPHEYLRIVASIVPKELNVTTTRMEELSDDELSDAIAVLRSVIAAGAVGEGEGPETQH